MMLLELRRELRSKIFDLLIIKCRREVNSDILLNPGI